MVVYFVPDASVLRIIHGVSTSFVNLPRVLRGYLRTVRRTDYVPGHRDLTYLPICIRLLHEELRTSQYAGSGSDSGPCPWLR